MMEYVIQGIVQPNIAIRIISANWEILAQGEGHITLHNIDQGDELFDSVLSVCKHSIDSLPPEFDQAYYKILKKMKYLPAYLLPKQEINLVNSQRQKMGVLLSWLCKKEIIFHKIYVCENLSRHRGCWDYFVQFKPKTPLPDIYSQDFLERISKKTKIALEELVNLFKSSPHCQKLRWFKKNVLKEKKNNMNSLSIFQLPDTELPNYQNKLRSSKKVEQQLPKGILSNEVIANQLRQTKVLEEILMLQMLYLQDNDLSEVDLSKIWRDEFNKQKEVEKALFILENQLQSGKNMLLALLQLFKGEAFIKHGISQKRYFEQILRFLISWSWRDVSIILRFRLDRVKNRIQASDLKIIDYQLKEASKLSTIILKDEQFLLNYLKYKQMF